uniref:Uncharacterized protein n=1 Tax=Arundo donax TaxID=35708 RepID=A0A0A9F372_ARUDO
MYKQVHILERHRRQYHLLRDHQLMDTDPYRQKILGGDSSTSGSLPPLSLYQTRRGAGANSARTGTRHMAGDKGGIWLSWRHGDKLVACALVCRPHGSAMDPRKQSP